jgi:transposase
LPPWDRNCAISAPPTYQELATLVAELQKELAATRLELAAARAEIVELRAQLAKNSQNSSKPPSSDLPGTRAPKVKRRKGRKRGGQAGHQAHQAAVPDHVDHVQVTRAPCCENCQQDLTLAEPTGSVSHYVYELPEIRPIVHQFQGLDLKCFGCGLVTPAPLPPGVPKGRYAPSVIAMVGLLRGELRQSVRQTSSVMSKVMHVPMSVGMVAKAQEQVSCALLPAYQQAEQYAKAHERPHADETSWALDKNKGWLWVAVCGLVTLFMIRASRGAEAAIDLLGPGFRGIVVTDRWAAYSWVQVAMRQLCWSHLKRDFKSFLDYGGEAKGVGEQLLCEVRRMFRAWHKVRDGTLTRAQFQLAMRPVRRRILALLEEGRGLPCRKVRGMCKHILGLQGALFTFIDHQGVEPTNNAAERALRFAVLWRKGCFGSDSVRGSRFVERILTVRATLRTQQRDLYAYLTAACTAALNGTAPPSLLPTSAELAVPWAMVA